MSIHPTCASASLIEELDAAEKRLWKIFAEGFGGISLLDTQGNIIYDGVGSKHLLGHALGADLGTPVFSRLHPDDLSKAQSFLKQVSDSPGATSSKTVLRFLHTDGTYRWIEGTITNNLNDPDVGAHVCRWHDVTSWKESEAELRRLGRFHSAVIDTAAEGVCVFQAIDQFPGVRFTNWNERMCAITGYSIEEVNLRGWQQTLLSGANESTQARFQTLTQGRETRAEEWAFIRSDGSRRVVALSTSQLEEGEEQFTVCLVEDVTDRWQAQQNLMKEEQRLRTALHAAGMISWVWTFAEGQTHFSADVATFFGASVPSGTGPFPGEISDLLIAPHDRERVRKSFHDSQSMNGEFSVQWEGITPGADGSPRWFASLGKLFLDAKSNTERMCGVTWEITQSRRAEEERRALERRVQDALRLESLGLLAGGVAHEFNNLLTSILGYAGQAREELPEDSPARAHLQQIETASCRAATLCSQMLAAAGRGRLVARPVDLSQSVRESLVLLRSALAHDLELNCVLADKLPSVSADAAQVQQVILNLALNAAEALDHRTGIITIRTGVQSLDAATLAQCIQGAETKPGYFAFIEVADEGPGMKPEIVSRIFEPFFTTKFTGRGMGLPAVLGVVRSHEGTLQVVTNPGEGTRVRVYFPVDEKAPELAEPHCPGSVIPRGEILIVDDDSRIRDLARRILTHEGHRAVLAFDGIDALERLEALAPTLSMALLDLTMPRLDGIETARRIRQRRPKLPIILMSGYAEQDYNERIAGMTNIRFLNKPFRRQAFLAAIQEVLAEARG
ncbi:hypothetical protein BH10PLA2_BH10PLA2_08670 [soil metagenome]